MEKRRLYVVRGVAQNGTIIYNCPTAVWALRKLRDFQASGRQDITVTDQDGAPLTEAELIGMVEGSGAAPFDEALPVTAQVTHQPAMT